MIVNTLLLYKALVTISLKLKAINQALQLRWIFMAF